MSPPAPLTVHASALNVELPAVPTVPTSVPVHAEGLLVAPNVTRTGRWSEVLPFGSVTGVGTSALDGDRPPVASANTKSIRSAGALSGKVNPFPEPATAHVST